MLDEATSTHAWCSELHAPARQDSKTSCATITIYEELAKTLFRSTDFLFLGRGIHFPIALEGALKLKEISYIHAEGYPAGEMKHGPNALIDENLPVVVLATRDPSSEESRLLYEKTLSNIQEVKAREGIVMAVACEGDDEVRQDGRPRDSRSPPRTNCCCRSSKSCRCSCWRITSPCAAAATWISRAIWPRASPSSSCAVHAPLEVPTRGKGLYPSRAKWRHGWRRPKRNRPADGVHPAHLGVADDSGERRPRRGAAISPISSSGWFRKTILVPPRHRRPRRHARAHPRGAHADQLSIPVIGGRMALGTWQGIYVFEHRSVRSGEASSCIWPQMNANERKMTARKRDHTNDRRGKRASQNLSAERTNTIETPSKWVLTRLLLFALICVYLRL